MDRITIVAAVSALSAALGGAAAPAPANAAEHKPARGHDGTGGT